MKRRLHRLYCLTEGVKTWLMLRFTPLGRIMLLSCCIAFVFGLGVQRTMIYQIFALTGLLLVFSSLFSRRFTTNIIVQRFLPESCVAGKKLYYRIQVENPGTEIERGLSFREVVQSSLPSWFEFAHAKEDGEDERNIFDKKMGYYRWLWLLQKRRLVESLDHALPDILPGEKKEIDVTLLPLRRGNIHFDGYVLGRADPLGLRRNEVHKTDGCNLLVLPRLYSAPQLFFEGKRKYHQGGIIAAQRQGDSNEFLSLREYVHGDPIKHIDWKATARTGSTIVKQYRDEYFSRYGLVLDSFTTKQFSAIFEEAVSVAASILMAQDNVNAILDLLFVGNECVNCTTGNGLEGQGRMLEILASVKTCQDKPFAELAGLVKSHASLLSGIVLVLVDLDDERRALVHYLTTHNIPLKILLIVNKREDVTGPEIQSMQLIPITVIEVGHVEEQLAEL
jgi:uncharacterized protein (DUF58 family)